MGDATPPRDADAITLAAILSSRDSLAEIDTQFERYSSRFTGRLGSIATCLTQFGSDGHTRPLMANIGLSHRAANLFALDHQLSEAGDPLAELCRLTETVRTPALRQLVRQTMCRWLSWRRNQATADRRKEWRQAVDRAVGSRSCV